MNSFLLFLTACIWGSAFVAQSVGMDFVEPFTFTFARSIIGGIVLIPCIPLLRRLKHEKRRGVTKIEWIGGLLCGVALFAASNMQQLGIVHTTVGKSGFITALYVVIVPIMGIFLKKKMPKIISPAQKSLFSFLQEVLLTAAIPSAPSALAVLFAYTG